MTDTNILERAESLCAKATPGEWFIDGSEIRHDLDPYATDEGISDCTVQICDLPRISEQLDYRQPDREFIAASRELVPELVSLVRKYQAALEEIGAIKCWDGEAEWLPSEQGEIARAALAQGEWEAR